MDKAKRTRPASINDAHIQNHQTQNCEKVLANPDATELQKRFATSLLSRIREHNYPQ